MPDPLLRGVQPSVLDWIAFLFAHSYHPFDSPCPLLIDQSGA
jgi:hypothetical protein